MTEQEQKPEAKEEPKKPLNIYQKLIEVRKQTLYIKKGTKAFNYNYAGGSDVIAALRPKMDEMGLLLVPNMESFEMIKVRKKEGEVSVPQIRISYTWINVDNPSERIVTEASYYEDAKPGCQGIGAIMTYAERYFLYKFFQIATDKDDIEQFYDKHGLEQSVDVIPYEEETEHVPPPVPVAMPERKKYIIEVEDGLVFGPAIWAKMREKNPAMLEAMPAEFAHYMRHLQKLCPEHSLRDRWENQTPDPLKIVPAMHEWSSTIDGDQEIELNRRNMYAREQTAKGVKCA